MTSDHPDPFVRFAARYGLQISTADLPFAPRDVLSAPANLEWFALVTIASDRTESAPMRTLFITEASDPRPPSVRDVLWWLASDSWALEQANRDFRIWAATYQYPEGEDAAMRLFRLHLDQAAALAALVGEQSYRELLDLYESSIGTQRLSAPARRSAST